MTAALMLSLLLAGPSAPPVSIYVGPQVKDGFIETDKGVRDSIKDIQGELRKKKALRVVTDEAEATLKLFVVKRTMGAQSGSGVAVGVAPGLGVLLGSRVRTVEAVLRFGSYERPLVGDDEGKDAWSECAEAIAKDVAIWLEANRERVAGQK
jgi:hypothetical protein